jgi:hypothetical protein
MNELANAPVHSEYYHQVRHRHRLMMTLPPQRLVLPHGPVPHVNDENNTINPKSFRRSLVVSRQVGEQKYQDRRTEVAVLKGAATAALLGAAGRRTLALPLTDPTEN